MNKLFALAEKYFGSAKNLAIAAAAFATVFGALDARDFNTFLCHYSAGALTGIAVAIAYVDQEEDDDQ